MTNETVVNKVELQLFKIVDTVTGKDTGLTYASKMLAKYDRDSMNKDVAGSGQRYQLRRGSKMTNETVVNKVELQLFKVVDTVTGKDTGLTYASKMLAKYDRDSMNKDVAGSGQRYQLRRGADHRNGESYA